jgi:hypothetical protein
MTTDRLALAHVLEDAGIQREGAEKVASAIFDAISDNVATKQDIARIEAKLELIEHRLMTRLGALVVVLLGLLFAALHYWPPGHG